MTAGFPGRPAVSVVVPVFNEADVLGELVSRCVAAIASAPTWELVVVDDASTDGTRSIAAGLCVDPRVRVEHLAANRGQLGATLHGLAASRGEWVVVLDGDLQDPPEVIGDLIATQQRLGVPVVLAVKAGRHDPVWMRAGSAVYHALQRLALPGAVPGGMGSFALFPGAVARAMAGVALPRGNLGAVLLASRLPFATVPSRKAERPAPGWARVGWWSRR